MENFEKCTVAMLGGPCSQHVAGNTSRQNQPQSAIILVPALPRTPPCVALELWKVDRERVYPIAHCLSTSVLITAVASYCCILSNIMVYSIIINTGGYLHTRPLHNRKYNRNLSLTWDYYTKSSLSFNSLAPGRSKCDFKNVIFNPALLIGIFKSSYDNVLRWMPQDLTDD